MDMTSSDSLPWIDSPVMLHSSRADTCKLKLALCGYRRGHWRYWYQADHVYGYATIYFMCAVIGVFTIADIMSRLTRRSKVNSLIGNSIGQRVLATSRFLAYRTFHLRGLRWYSPSVGVMLLGICGVIYFFGTAPRSRCVIWHLLN